MKTNTNAYKILLESITFSAVIAFVILPLKLLATYETITFQGKKYDDKTIAELVTVITSTNPIPSIPNTHHLYNAQKSLFKIPGLALCKKIIVFDGVQPGFTNRIDLYEKYKENVRVLTETDKYFANTTLVFCESWGHLSGAIKKAIELVKTPFVFIHQNDLVIVKEFDLNGLVATMEANPFIKHVRLNRGPINAYFVKWDGPVDEKIEGNHFVPLCRTFGWSDQSHIATVDYYKKFVLPRCGHSFMERFLNPAFKKQIEKKGKNRVHPAFGTYLYGGINDGGYISHSDAQRRL